MLAFIIQARTGSTRLPEKTILPFYEGKGILELLLQKLKENFPDIPTILATTEKKGDEKIEAIGIKENVPVFRGSEENVLLRFIEAAEKHRVSKIIRICADNPFLDVSALKQLVGEFKTFPVDYLYFCTSSGLPSIKTHFGFWAEGVSLEALKRIQNQAHEAYYKEHVTNFIYEKTSGFSTKSFEVPKEIEKQDLRLTVDTKEDFDLLSGIYAQIQKEGISRPENIASFIASNEAWTTRMKDQINLNSK